jgi:chromosomal replication initiation ATPase DnaA
VIVARVSICVHCGKPSVSSPQRPDDATRDACKVAVARTGIRWRTLLKPGRTTAVVRARWRAMNVLRVRGYSLSEIGRRFGCHHSTVLYGLRQLAAGDENRSAGFLDARDENPHS